MRLAAVVLLLLVPQLAAAQEWSVYFKSGFKVLSGIEAIEATTGGITLSYWDVKSGTLVTVEGVQRMELREPRKVPTPKPTAVEEVASLTRESPAAASRQLFASPAVVRHGINQFAAASGLVVGEWRSQERPGGDTIWRADASLSGTKFLFDVCGRGTTTTSAGVLFPGEDSEAMGTILGFALMILEDALEIPQANEDDIHSQIIAAEDGLTAFKAISGPYVLTFASSPGDFSVASYSARED